MTTDDSGIRRLRGSLAANSRWAVENDRTKATAPARSAFMDRFVREVDPDEQLDPAERERRAASARKAYFQRLALKSAQSRAAKAAKKAPALPQRQAEAAVRAALAREELRRDEPR